MRTAGIILICLIPVFLGGEYRRSLKNGCAFWEQLCRLNFFISEQIRFCLREKDEIFALALTDHSFSHPLIKDILSRAPKPEDLRKIIKDYTDIRFNNREIEGICGFFDNLGKSDVEGQLSHCGLYLSLFEDISSERGRSLYRKSKLALVLSASAGAVAFILTI